MFYNGPGIYRHYKGDHYRVIGIGQLEKTGAKVVIYHSYSLPHERRRAEMGIDFICRPLNFEDGPDAFNMRATNGEPRFVKVM